MALTEGHIEIACIQETHNERIDTQEINTSSSPDVITVRGNKQMVKRKSKRAGVAIVIKKNAPPL